MRSLRLSVTCYATFLALAVGCAGHQHGPGGPLPALRFAELDANEDEAIDAEEFRTLSDAIFRRLDSDQDGKISETEYKEFAERRRSHQRPRGPRPGGPDSGWPGGGGGPY